MKISTSFKVVLLFAGTLVVIAAQWRTVSRLRYENRELQGAREQAAQTRAELEQVTQSSAQHESEAETLRTEVVTLRNELQTVRRELEQHRRIALHAPAAQPLFHSSREARAPALTATSKSGQEHYLSSSGRANLFPFDSNAGWLFENGFYVDDLRLVSGISLKTVNTGPDWSPSEPLPLSFSAAEETGRAELQKLVQNERSWYLWEITLRRAPALEGQESPKWYYTLQFLPRGGKCCGDSSYVMSLALSGALGVTGTRTGR
jgi:hypothetical protein